MTGRGALRAAILHVLQDGPATALDVRRRLLEAGVERPMDSIIHALRAAARVGAVGRSGSRGGGADAGYVWALAEAVQAATPVPSVRVLPEPREDLSVPVKLRMRPSEVEIIDARAAASGIDRSTQIRLLIAQAMGWAS